MEIILILVDLYGMQIEHYFLVMSNIMLIPGNYFYFVTNIVVI